MSDMKRQDGVYVGILGHPQRRTIGRGVDSLDLKFFGTIQDTILLSPSSLQLLAIVWQKMKEVSPST